MGIDTRIKFFNKKTKTPLFLINGNELYIDELIGNRYIHDIIDNLKDKYIEANDDNTPNNLCVDYKNNYYFNPILISLKKLIKYKSDPYQEGKQQKHYMFLYNNLISYYGTSFFEKNNIENIYLVIETF